MKSETQLATVQPQEPSVALMLQTVIQQGITEQNVAALDKLCGLYERMQAKDAERAYAVALAALQSEMPKIEPTRGIPDRNGNAKYRYAPYEEIMRKVRPLLSAHGFTVTFDSDFADGRVVVTCWLQHSAGHKVATKHAARVGHGPVNASEAQADGAAQTYAKRFALCSALNIVIEHDTDAENPRNEGGPITQQQADELRDWCDATKSDRTKFLAVAGAKTFEDIPSAKLAMLEELLRKKEARR